MISLKTEKTTVAVEMEDIEVDSGTIIDITKSNSSWYEIWLGDEYIYIDTYTGNDGEEHFNLVSKNNEELLTNDEWNDR